MSSFKKIAWSGSAVLLALVMALGLMATPKPAAAAGEALSAATVAVAATVNLTGTVTGSVNETQALAVATACTAGTFTLTYGGQTTTAIAYNATAATVQAALVALSSVGAGGVTVASTAGADTSFAEAGASGVTVTFLRDGNAALITASIAACTTGATFSATETLAGANGTQTIAVASDAASTGTVTYPAALTLDNSAFDTNKLNGAYSLTITGASAGSVIINVSINAVLTAQLSLTVTGAVVIPPGGTATCVANTLCVDAMVLMPPGSSTTCTTAAITAATIVVNGGTTIAGAAGRPGQNPADGSVAGVICAHISTNSTRSIDSNVTPLVVGTDAQGLAVNWTSSVGYLSTGTAKTTTSVVGSTGWVGTNYRGAGNIIATDTVIIAVQGPTSAVGTLTINLTAGSGTNPSKITWQAPSVLAVAANVTNTSPQYSSPTIGTNIAVQVTDAGGLGVNNETVLLSTDKGFLVSNPGFALLANANCAGAAAKSISLPTVGTNSLSPGGQLSPGTIDITYCANQLDAPGKATITAQNISTTMANATTSLSMAGRPSKLTATATGNAVTATVTDAGGNNVPDGTPVRFTISSNAGAVSVANGCTTSTNGAASAVVALTAATGTVIVSADWNEGGTSATAATCVGAGSQQIATSVTVPGGTSTTGGTGATGGTGVLTSGSVPATGFGLIVFSGGTIAQLVTASAVGNQGALYATVGGIFVPYVPGTTIAAVNADFLAAFPGGNIPANTAFVGRK